MMVKKSNTWGIQKCHVFMIFVTVFVIIMMSTLRRNNWQDHNRKSISYFDSLSCDMFSGRWVYDNSTHPLYSGLACSYMNDEIACDKFGRKDLRYQSWRWQPLGCNLPRFDAREMMERLRGKRMVYVGDSLNRNQWVSMVCLVESSLANQHNSFTSNGSLMSFKSEEYNASIEFYWSPVLVESNCDDPVNHRISERIMRADAIEEHARHWRDADVLIFNSYLWWKKPRMKMKVLYGSFDDENKSYKEVEMLEGFELALKTWAEFLALHVDTLKAKVFFVSLSPTHVWGEDWGMASNLHNCYNETEPIAKEGYTGRGTDYRFTQAVEVEIEGLKKRGVNVQMLNITHLSEYRKDGHPSIYRKQWDPLGEDQLANPPSYSDCTHWCLPGVPDVRNLQRKSRRCLQIAVTHPARQNQRKGMGQQEGNDRHAVLRTCGCIGYSTSCTTFLYHLYFPVVGGEDLSCMDWVYFFVVMSLMPTGWDP